MHKNQPEVEVAVFEITELDDRDLEDARGGSGYGPNYGPGGGGGSGGGSGSGGEGGTNLNCGCPDLQ